MHYADDTQLYISVSQPSATTTATLDLLESALFALFSWFSHNGLALNPEKSDAILLGTHGRHRSLSEISTVNIAGSVVPLSDHVQLLGVTLDSTLTFQKHVSLVSQSCFYHIKSFRHIRHLLDNKTAGLIGHSLVSSRLNYANSVLIGAPKSSVLKLQRVQNALARVVLKPVGRVNSSLLLRQLHWLPVTSRIDFKLATLTYNARTTGSPTYLSSLLQSYNPSRTLRSSDKLLLQTIPTKTNFGSRAFRSAAPSIWNSLPLHVRSADSLLSFKRNLKTHYFSLLH